MSVRSAVPFEYQDGILTITVFQGAVTTRVLPDSKRAFLFEVTLRPHHPCLQCLPKPPEHFHPYQEEYVEVLQGALVVEVEGIEHVLSPGDAVFTVNRGANHRLYPPRQVADVPNTVRFFLSAEQIARPFKLDLGFFENWYMYQEQLVVHGKKLDFIQVLSMFDAGDSYLTLPWWIPFRSTASRLMGIVLGRWVGRLLGYQPFYREWTTDWDLACKKMKMA